MTRTESGLAGSLLDRRYRVDRLLARGGMSSVYRGMDTRLDRPVAIKVMDPRFADDRTFVERFEREARSAAKLHHPGIVAVHDQGIDIPAGSDERRAFLVMELVDGGTLRDLVEARGALDIPLALTIAENVLSALAAAHAAGLVHRDVKPENVLIGPGGTAGSAVVKVADFGLVRAVAGAGTTSSTTILGTVAYLSPEQVTSGAATARGDVYSAGILLYEMLTGQVPYTGDTAISVAYRHVNDDVPAPSRLRPDLPPALDDLVLRVTRRDPDSRPHDAAAFLADLRRLRHELGIGPVPVPVPRSATLADGDDADTVESERTLPSIPAVVPVSGGPRGTQAMLRPVTSYQESPPPMSQVTVGPSRGRGLWIALWTAAALLLTGGIGAGVWWFVDGRWIDIPQVANMDPGQAERILRDADLTPRATERRHNTVPSGTVIGTEPGSGQRALRGAEVTLLVSLGKPVVPDIAPGTNVAQAQKAIRAVQLNPVLNPDGDLYSAEVPENAVISVSPVPGSQANIGDPVTLVLSKGPPPQPVPDVTGQTRDEAFAALEAAGFQPYDVAEEFSESIPAGHVTRTDPAAGGTSGDLRVGVYVSNSVAVPSVVGMNAPDAVRTLQEAGLTFAGTDGTNGLSFVVNQDPAAGTLVQKEHQVNLTMLP